MILGSAVPPPPPPALLLPHFRRKVLTKGLLGMI